VAYVGIFSGVALPEPNAESIVLAVLVASLTSLYAVGAWVVRMVIKSEVRKLFVPYHAQYQRDQQRQRIINERIRQALHALKVEGFEPHNVYPEGD